MNRRSFLASLAALTAAPSAIAKLQTAPKPWTPKVSEAQMRVFDESFKYVALWDGRKWEYVK